MVGFGYLTYGALSGIGDNPTVAPMNAVTDFVDANLDAGRADHVAIIETDSGREWRYADVARRVGRMGRALTRLGVRPEERVLLLLPDGEAFVAAFFGAIRIGAVAVPVNTLLTTDDYRYLLSDSRARVLVVHARFLERIDAIAEPLPCLQHIVVVGDGPPAHPRLDDLLDAEDDAIDPPLDMHEDDAAFWLYSSGTTGAPKGVIHLQHDMRVCAESFGVGVMGMVSTDRTLSVAKLSFAYGLGNALYMPFFVGATTLLCPDKPDPARVFAIAARYRPTLLFAVPTAYSAMLAAIDGGAAPDLSSVRLCSSAGEPLAASIYDRWRAHTGVEMLDGIGSTEALHTFIANRSGRVRPGSTGQVVSGFDARIVDADDRDVPDGEIGHLLVKGQSICAGYWNKRAQTRRTIVGEWLRSGDLFRRDVDGYYWYQGRSDDMLKSGAYWISPAEIEAALLTHSAVLECAVVGQEDEARLIKPMAFIVLTPNQTPSAGLGEALQAHVKQRLAVYKYPRWIEFVAELPRTATGKVQRYKLRTRPR